MHLHYRNVLIQHYSQFALNSNNILIVYSIFLLRNSHYKAKTRQDLKCHELSSILPIGAVHHQTYNNNIGLSSWYKFIGFYKFPRSTQVACLCRISQYGTYYWFCCFFLLSYNYRETLKVLDTWSVIIF
jgi:hypothetical protein